MPQDSPSAHPLVSIVIPTFNQSRFLREAVESALGQSYPNTEVIVVDNDSTDETGRVLQSFADRIRVFRQENLGPSSARNRGAKEAKGEYVVFVDGDDVLLEDCVAERVRLLIEQPGLGLVVGAFRIVDADRHPMWDDGLGKHPGGPLSLETMFESMYGPTCGLAVNRSKFLAIGGYDETFRIAEDSDLAIRLTASSGATYDPIPRAEYRQAGPSLSRDPLLLLDSYRRMVEKNAGLAPDRAQYWAIVNPALKDRMANMIFGKQVKERGLGAIPGFLRLFIVRPSTIATFAFWVARFLRNRFSQRAFHSPSL